MARRRHPALEVVDDIRAKNGHRDDKPAPTFNLTDQGNAERLVHRHGEDLLHVRKWGQWMVWDGTRWRPDETGEAERKAKETVKTMFHEADPGEGRPIDRNLASYALKSESRQKIEAMVALARSEEGIAVTHNDFDQDPWALNVQNGTLDLRTGKLRPHRREDGITKIAGTAYDPEAKAPTWTAFIERVLPSEALRRFVQKLAGYGLSADVSEQILPFLYGLGANGKSTFVNTLLAVVGEYGQQAAPDLLVAKKSAHPTELADLFGARLVASVEVEDGRRLAESLVKQLTGGEKVRARYMHKDFFEFDPTHKPLLVANHRPEVRGTDHAIWRRIKLVPFDVTIPDEEKDKDLPGKLMDELPGILRWAVEGCLLWRKEGLGEPEEVKAATQNYRDEMDVLGRFIEDRCVLHERATALATPLYEAYQKWCEETGETEETQNKFGRRLRERGLGQDREKGTRRTMWLGIGLWQPTDPQDVPPEGGDSETIGNEKRSETRKSQNTHTNGNIDSFSKNGSKSFPALPNVSETAPEQLSAFLADPPRWWLDVAAHVAGEGYPGGLVRTLARNTATEVYGDHERWGEVLGDVQDWLEREG